ncbi:MAG TPA: asparagine synthetase B [Pseudolabrys sp.]|jgi:asparagine synthase (glutamine-hydrolysing)|nr:asparagine synthetase B [Pseudolabrys sp.]
MCGIAVAIDWPDAESTVRTLIEGILHRGDITDPIASPRPNTAMGTRRLRIVDAAQAIQPQVSFCGQLAVSFNGEVYNHEDLRRELTDLGIPFKTESDTEVLANALQVWGYRALERVIGMYAFVALDIQSGEFLAARDPFGVKPLYVIQSATGFLFCSEIRPLLDTVESGDVMLLPPGYALSRKTVGRFKSPIYPRVDAPCASDPRVLDRLLSEAVARRMPPGLRVATLFSGGIDSTLIAHYARQFRPESPGYFVGGTDAPDYPFAAAYAERTGLDLRLVPFEPESDEVFASIGRVVEVAESFEPNLVRGAVCSLKAAERMHRDGFRVALCGEGADELFCGYPPLELAFSEGNSEGAAFRDECLNLMHRVSLQRVDRCSMRHQVETREPFLDPAVVKYALNLDADALVCEKGGLPVGKVPLRALYDLYPDELPALIRDRTKVPFGEGAGLDVSPRDSVWKMRFEDAISDRDLAEGQQEFFAFNVQSKEELYYLRTLTQTMDVTRVPHLRDRAWISFPVTQKLEELKAYAHYSL